MSGKTPWWPRRRFIALGLAAAAAWLIRRLAPGRRTPPGGPPGDAREAMFYRRVGPS